MDVFKAEYLFLENIYNKKEVSKWESIILKFTVKN